MLWNTWKKNPDVKRLVSHSLASAVVNHINKEMPDKYATTTYATPTIKPRRKGKQDPRHKDYRNPNDVGGLLDGYGRNFKLERNKPFISTQLYKFRP